MKQCSQISVSKLYKYSRLIFTVFSASVMCILCTGCVDIMMTGFVAELTKAYYSVDPMFSKTHDLNFKQPTTKTQVVIYFGGVYAETFLEAITNTGAFSQVVEVTNKIDLQEYPGWNVIRVEYNNGGIKGPGWDYARQYKEEYKFRFEFQASGEPTENVYSSVIWMVGGWKKQADVTHPVLQGKIPNDAAHPVMPSMEQTQKLIAKEMVLAAFTDAQKSGRYFQ